ncbi:methyltransferase domain-containing protein [Paenalcaligenes sp. Me131]|uniref:methyltransferase domain-containing protein n=1 Tax=Paenalcaligenes sp. Me131 TaxID=3392636 RepID=UPI003D2657BD
MLIHDVDFAQMYREHMLQSDRSAKSASAWDARAKELKGKPLQSEYAQQFVAHMNLEGAKTLLDVGCGTGTIGITVAPQLQKVIGLDYSAEMLERMQEHADAAGLTNVHTLCKSWYDDWSDVPTCDIVVASRSSLVADMQEALQRMTSKATKHCYMTHLVDGHFGDAAIAEVLGKNKRALPDYIYIVNILFSMGFHPKVDYLCFPGRLAGTKNVEEFIGKVRWTFGDLSEQQLSDLRQWYAEDDERAQQGGGDTRWAMISWDVDKVGR